VVKKVQLSEKDFNILDALDRQEISTQRQLAENTGISLGQVNYVLRSLLEKGLVKIGNFKRSPHKIGYAYLLTPKGIEEKSRLTAKFVMKRLKEYNNLRDRLIERLSALESNDILRIIFVGPASMNDFVATIVKEKNLKLKLTGNGRTLDELTAWDPDSFDRVILFDGNMKHARKAADAANIPRNKLISLW